MFSRTLYESLQRRLHHTAALKTSAPALGRCMVLPPLLMLLCCWNVVAAILAVLTSQAAAQQVLRQNTTLPFVSFQKLAVQC